MNRILLNNIWIRLESNKYVIMNLTSLRREYLSEYSYNLFVNIASKISNSQVLNKQEQSFYDHLLQTKQILTPEIQKEADELIKKSIIVPKIINGLMINLTYKHLINEGL